MAGKTPKVKDRAAAAVPYKSSQEHLWDEIARLDLLLRAATIRWRATLAATKPPDSWGMVNVSEAEVDNFLNSAFVPPGAPPPSLSGALEPLWSQAATAAEAIALRCEATPDEVELRTRRIQQLFGLSPLDRDILLLAALPELDPRYGRLLGYLQDDLSRPCPVVELVTGILLPVAPGLREVRDALAAESILSANRLVSVTQAARDEGLARSFARASPRIVAYLLGSDCLDDQLRDAGVSLLVPLDSRSLILEPKFAAKVEGLATAMNGPDGPCGVVVIRGPRGVGRVTSARAICSRLGVPVLAVDAEAALTSAPAWNATVDLTFREARLRGSAVVWRDCDSLAAGRNDPSGAAKWTYLMSAAERFRGPVFVTVQAALDPMARLRGVNCRRLDLAAPGYKQRQELWSRLLEGTGLPPDRVAAGFQFTPGQMLDAWAAARSSVEGRGQASPAEEDLLEGCRRQSGSRLSVYARRIEPVTKLEFDDLVLPAANRKQLDEVRQRIRDRLSLRAAYGLDERLNLGRGLMVLFTGSSGTGKTMAAELLAKERGVDLYKVDLSAIVSKWVGETEKNLDGMFAEAEGANAIIFFDEADALFGKRGEVKAAQDRWANLEVNYLLQRVEEYAGVVILASNLRQHIDEAFMRRIQLVVEFPGPDAEARFRIWTGMFPPGATRPSDQELRLLSDRIRLPGGSIKNIVVDSAFRAVGDGAKPSLEITTRHLVLSSAREYQKLGKPITKGEFGEEYFRWIEEELL